MSRPFQRSLRPSPALERLRRPSRGAQHAAPSRAHTAATGVGGAALPGTLCRTFRRAFNGVARLSPPEGLPSPACSRGLLKTSRGYGRGDVAAAIQVIEL